MREGWKKLGEGTWKSQGGGWRSLGGGCWDVCIVSKNGSFLSDYLKPYLRRFIGHDRTSI